jgi:hypothetical protein
MNSPIRFFHLKPHSPLRPVWLFVFILILVSSLTSCEKEDSAKSSYLQLKTGVAYTTDGAHVPVGGQIRIGILASGAGCPLTYLKITRISAGDTVTQLDRGIYIGREGLDQTFTFSKDTAASEIWTIVVMNADRDTAVKSLTVLRGEGSGYGSVNYFPTVTLSFQNSSAFNHFLDADNGQTYDENSVGGHESEIDLLCYFYVTSGLPSPSFTCPGYTAAVGYYPVLNNWTKKNTTLFDYQTTDNNLVSIGQFDAALNDSLLVTAYKPDKVSGNCKYGYTGKIIPFKTEKGKYGLIKVIRADETETGSIEISIKIQQ